MAHFNFESKKTSPEISKLSAQRRAHRITQSELGRRIGRSQTWVTLIETGNYLPTDAEILMIHKALTEMVADGD